LLPFQLPTTPTFPPLNGNQVCSPQSTSFRYQYPFPFIPCPSPPSSPISVLSLHISILTQFNQSLSL
jgi:hypothetical protein